VDKIAMAKKFEVEGWLLPACVALVERQAPFTYVEAMKLGLEMMVQLCEAREKRIQRPQSPFATHEGWGVPRPSGSGQPNKDSIQLVKEILGIK
jgi:hypothetical protein